MSFFPFYIDIEGKNCLVIGGGTVALRKIEKIAPFKPKIVVIAPEICEEIRKLDIVCRFRKFEDGDLENTDFVICATNDESLNTHIFQLCNSKKLLINTVDNKENCSFIFPAIARSGDVTVAITTEGKSPVLARYLKERFKAILNDEEGAGAIAEKLGSYRKIIKDSVHSETGRKSAFSRLLNLCIEGKSSDIDNQLVQKIIEEENHEN